MKGLYEPVAVKRFWILILTAVPQLWDRSLDMSEKAEWGCAKSEYPAAESFRFRGFPVIGGKNRIRSVL